MRPDSQRSELLRQIDWQDQLDKLEYAHGKPLLRGDVKASVEDFRVSESMDIQLDGKGEHVWLRIKKQRQNTEQVAKILARFAAVAYRDVGYSGIKDYFAITEQWFSIWRPKGDALDWNQFHCEGVQILEHGLHSRKLKRGTHKANHFEIVIRNLDANKASSEQIKQALNDRCELINTFGVPNYYGSQRFGRQANNMNQAISMLLDGRRVKNRNLRSLILSSARSWMFNLVVSERVKANTWQQLMLDEPANLDNTNSVFISTKASAEQDRQRVLDFDIHPTGPLWGRGVDKLMNQKSQLTKIERHCLAEYAELCTGLEKAGLEYQRRSLRLRPRKFKWHCEGGNLHLGFELGKGQFATSVLRELVTELVCPSTKER